MGKNWATSATFLISRTGVDAPLGAVSRYDISYDNCHRRFSSHVNVWKDYYTSVLYDKAECIVEVSSIHMETESPST